MLADSPAFDIELNRAVPIELIAGSCRAIDPLIVVERRGECIACILMRGIEVEGTVHMAVVSVGDRKRLHEVHARVLAPLHADVGIVAMRMGDRDTLTALVGPAAPGDRRRGVSGAGDRRAARSPEPRPCRHEQRASSRGGVGAAGSHRPSPLCDGSDPDDWQAR